MTNDNEQDGTSGILLKDKVGHVKVVVNDAWPQERRRSREETSRGLQEAPVAKLMSREFEEGLGGAMADGQGLGGDVVGQARGGGGVSLWGVAMASRERERASCLYQ